MPPGDSYKALSPMITPTKAQVDHLGGQERDLESDCMQQLWEGPNISILARPWCTKHRKAKAMGPPHSAA